ncbi:MAG: rhodanese-like domain-containing protein [Acidimicrobiia bacterium]
MVTAIDRSQLLRLMEFEDAQVVDVLPGREYEEAHLPDAISIPLREFTAESVSILSREKPVVVYCHDGL